MGVPGTYIRAFRFRRPPRGTARERRPVPDGRTLGSCTAELVLVANGTLRASVFLQPGIWDVAAGAVIVAEAGGRVLTWAERAWQPLARFDAAPPPKGPGEAALRHWTQPVIVGAPLVVDRLTSRLAWHPRLPKPLRRILGFDRR